MLFGLSRCSARYFSYATLCSWSFSTSSECKQTSVNGFTLLAITQDFLLEKQNANNEAWRTTVWKLRPVCKRKKNSLRQQPLSLQKFLGLWTPPPVISNPFCGGIMDFFWKLHISANLRENWVFAILFWFVFCCQNFFNQLPSVLGCITGAH